MTNQTAYDVVQAYHRAWTTSDVEAAMSYVADGIVCRAPGVDLDGKQAYRDYIAGFAPKLTGIGDIAEFIDGDRVALFYYPQTAATSTAPAAECFTVRDGRIVESVLTFDRLSYAHPVRPSDHADDRWSLTPARQQLAGSRRYRRSWPSARRAGRRRAEIGAGCGMARPFWRESQRIRWDTDSSA